MRLAGHLCEFLRQHPGIDVRLYLSPVTEMPAMVENGELDCAIMPVVDHRGRLRLTSLGAESLALTCHG